MNSKPDNAYNKMQKSAFGLIKDGLRLLDLQFQLLSLDVFDFWKKAKWGIVGTVVAAILMLSAAVVGMSGVADFIHATTNVREEVAKMLVGGISLAIAAVIVLVSLRALTKASSSLKRSHDEFRENLLWLREVLSKDE